MGVCDPLYPPGSWEFYRTLASTLFCIVGAALCAGLTMGLISLDELELLILLETTPEDCSSQAEREELLREQAYARKVLPLIRRHHQLLVTLLLLNSLANESLPLFLDSLVPSWLAIVLSVTLILLFGEIIPSAFFTGSSQLRVSSYFAPLVYFFLFVTAPIAYPVAKLLDRCMGDPSLDGDYERYTKAQLMALLRLHAEDDGLTYSPVSSGPPMLVRQASSSTSVRWRSNPSSSSSSSAILGDSVLSERSHRSSTSTATSRNGGGRRSRNNNNNHHNNTTPAPGPLGRNELQIMHGALRLRDFTAADIMTPRAEVFALSEDTLLNMETLAKIVYKGHSRIPVHARDDPSRVVGVLLTKLLTTVNPADNKRLSASLRLKRPVFVPEDLALDKLLRSLKTARSHFAVVVKKGGEDSENSSREFVGVVALIDVIEKMVNDSFDDEDSNFHNLSRLDSSWILGTETNQGGGGAVGMDESVVAPAVGRLRLLATKTRSFYFRWRTAAETAALAHYAGGPSGGGGLLSRFRPATTESEEDRDDVETGQARAPLLTSS